MGFLWNIAKGREGLGQGLVLCAVQEGVQGEEWDKCSKVIQNIFYGG